MFGDSIDSDIFCNIFEEIFNKSQQVFQHAILRMILRFFLTDIFRDLPRISRNLDILLRFCEILTFYRDFVRFCPRAYKILPSGGPLAVSWSIILSLDFSLRERKGVRLSTCVIFGLGTTLGQFKYHSVSSPASNYRFKIL